MSFCTGNQLFALSPACRPKFQCSEPKSSVFFGHNCDKLGKMFEDLVQKSFFFECKDCTRLWFVKPAATGRHKPKRRVFLDAHICIVSHTTILFRHIWQWYLVWKMFIDESSLNGQTYVAIIHTHRGLIVRTRTRTHRSTWWSCPKQETTGPLQIIYGDNISASDSLSDRRYKRPISIIKSVLDDDHFDDYSALIQQVQMPEREKSTRGLRCPGPV